LYRGFALDRLSISGNLQKRALAQRSNDERLGLVKSHLLEAADATDRYGNILAATALLQKMEIGG
jgi:hypothetical protein